MKKASLSSMKGVYSTKENPMAQPKRTSSLIGPGSNSDANKANKLMQKAHMEKESLRGKSGM